jgi:hypothetical protein
MTADVLLSCLDRVRKTGAGRWLALCPAHEDRSPSLSIRELDDGRVLINDFAGCGPAEILAAIGLDFDALYPARAVDDHHRSPGRRPVHAEDCLRAVAREAQIAAIVAARVAHGYAVDWDELDRLMIAAARLANAAVIGGVDAHEQKLRARIGKQREQLARAW